MPALLVIPEGGVMLVSLVTVPLPQLTNVNVAV